MFSGVDRWQWIFEICLSKDASGDWVLISVKTLKLYPKEAPYQAELRPEKFPAKPGLFSLPRPRSAASLKEVGLAQLR